VQGRFTTGNLVATAALVAAIVAPTAAQAPQAPVAFEVASVRRNTSGDGRSMMDGSGGRYTVTNATLRALVRIAYELQEEQLVAPGWIDSARFDIRASRGGAPFDQVPAMLRTLLAERFNLAAHVEAREMPMYALVMARSDGRLGMGLVPATDCEGRTNLRPGAMPRPGERMLCQTQMIVPGSIRGGGMRMRDVAPLLSGAVGRLVIDRTGLEGRYDVELTWTPDQRRAVRRCGSEPRARSVDIHRPPGTARSKADGRARTS
jgi:uncharacterized protein (TIGR03435 family)